MRYLFRILLTVSSSIWMMVIFFINRSFNEKHLAWLLLCLIPVLLSIVTLGLFRLLGDGDEDLSNYKEIVLADSDLIPVYLGYFFVSVSINKLSVMIFIFILVSIFLYLSQTQYFNPVFLLFGYHYYYMITEQGTRIFLIKYGSVIRNKNNCKKIRIKRINDSTYIGLRKDV